MKTNRPLAALAAVALTGALLPSSASAQFPLEPGMIVTTCDTFAFGIPTPSPYVLGTIDVRDPDCEPAAQLGTNWLAPMYHNEMPNPTGDPLDEWTDTNLGHVFGLAIDDAAPPNIYVTSTSMFSTSGGTGEVFMLDGSSGAISLFATLPNALGPSGFMPGLGNIAFDANRQQFYVTNHEDGTIYRLDMSGTTVETFDPFVADDGSPGFCPLGERLWAIGLHEDRVYFSVWAEDASRPSATQANTVWSVAINPATGAFVPADTDLEVTIDGVNLSNWSMPVSDVAFSKDGLMFVAERSMQGDHEPNAHQSRILEFEGGHLAWAPSSHVFELGALAGGLNSAGGVDYDCNEADACNIGPRVWATGDALQFGPQYIYGVQALPATGGTPADSYLIDFDGITNSSDVKSSIGDVEVYRVCDVCALPVPDATWSGGPCVGDTITLDASSSICDLAFTDYRWLESATVVPGCDWSPTPTCDVIPAGPTIYTLEVRCGAIIDCISTLEVAVSVDPQPIPALALPTQICLGSEIMLDASATDPNGCSGPLDYQYWEGATLLQPWSPAATYGPLVPPGSTTYSLEVRCGGCLHGESLNIDVVPPPTAAAGGDVVTCADLPLTLDASGSIDPGCPGGLLYEWFRGAVRVQGPSGVATYDPPTSTPGTFDYSVVVSCAGLPGCESSDPLQLRVNACVLAVDFDGYDASLRPDGAVVVRWATIDEQATLGFEVQRASDANGTFVTVDGVAARGGGSTYTLVDRTAPPGIQPWYRVVELTVTGPGDMTPAFTLTASEEDRRSTGGRGRGATRRLR